MKIRLKEKTWVSVFTLLGSLTAYYYSKAHTRETVPYVMTGGFIGAWVGEFFAKTFEAKQNKDNNKANEQDTQNKNK
ncbi:MAG: hypothetical protein KF900_09365 [Bacteroidetes bacterium]|nr:hypothetical protein [Bacteroidota bacterium]